MLQNDKGVKMNNKRLKNAENKYCLQKHEWLTNPQNEDLPDEIIEQRLQEAFDEFLKELCLDEDESAEFISGGCVLDELEFLRTVFDYFKSEKIYEAIKTNCEIAFSHKYVTESQEIENERKELIVYMQKQLF